MVDMKSTTKRVATTVVAATVAGAAVVYGTPVVLGLVGFGKLGVTAGSTAAAAQSCIYGAAVPAGSIFAAAQSIGAAGLSTGAAAVGVVPTVAVSAFKALRRRK